MRWRNPTGWRRVVLWILTFAAAGYPVAFFGWLYLRAAPLDRERALADYVYRPLWVFAFVGLFASLVALNIVRTQRHGRGRAKVLALRNPDAVVIPVLLDEESRTALNGLPGVSAAPDRFRRSATIIADERGIEFWLDSEHRFPWVSVPWDQIAGVTMTDPWFTPATRVTTLELITLRQHVVRLSLGFHTPPSVEQLQRLATHVAVVHQEAPA